MSIYTRRQPKRFWTAFWCRGRFVDSILKWVSSFGGKRFWRTCVYVYTYVCLCTTIYCAQARIFIPKPNEGSRLIHYVCNLQFTIHIVSLLYDSNVRFGPDDNVLCLFLLFSFFCSIHLFILHWTTRICIVMCAVRLSTI